MARPFESGPGQFSNRDTGPGMTLQPFVQPTEKFSAFGAIISALPQAMNLGASIIDSNTNATIGDYQSREAKAKRAAAEKNDPKILQDFYDAEMSNRVPKIRTDSTTKSAAIIESRRQIAEQEAQKNLIGETDYINATTSGIKLGFFKTGDTKAALKALDETRTMFGHREDLKDHFNAVELDIRAQAEEIEYRSVANQKANYTAAVRQADEMAGEIDKLVGIRLGNPLDPVTQQLNAAATSDTASFLLRMYSNEYLQVSGSGEDTLGEDNLPKDPVIRAAILSKAHIKLAEYTKDKANEFIKQRDNTAVTALTVNLSQARSEEEMVQAITDFQATGAYRENVDSAVTALTTVASKLIGELDGKINQGLMTPEAAMAKINMLDKISKSYGMQFGNSLNAAVNGVTAASELYYTNNVLKSSHAVADGATPEAALNHRLANGVPVLNLALAEEAAKTGIFTAASVERSVLSGPDALETNEPFGSPIKKSLQVTYKKLLDTTEHKRNVEDVLHDIATGGRVSETDIKMVTNVSRSLWEGSGIQNLPSSVLSTLNMTTNDITRIMASNDPADDGAKLKIFHAAASYDVNVFRAADMLVDETSLKHMSDNLGSTERGRILQGIVQLRAYGGVASPAVRKWFEQKNTEWLDSDDLIRMITASSYLGEDGVLKSKNGKDFFSAYLADVRQAMGTGVKVNKLEELGPQFKGLDSSLHPNTLSALKHIAGSLTSRPGIEVGTVLQGMIEASGFKIYTDSNGSVGLLPDQDNIYIPPKEQKDAIIHAFNAVDGTKFLPSWNKEFGYDLPAGATLWDFFVKSQGLPPDSHPSDFDWKLDYDPTVMQNSIDGKDLRSPEAFFNHGGQIMFRYKDGISIPAPSWTEAATSLFSLPAYTTRVLVDQFGKPQQWYGARIGNRPWYFNKRVGGAYVQKPIEVPEQHMTPGSNKRLVE